MLPREGETMPAVRQVEEEQFNEIEAALAFHGGNAEATIETLLEDLKHLKLQLALAEGAMSQGMTRGWRPSYERSDS